MTTLSNSTATDCQQRGSIPRGGATLSPGERSKNVAGEGSGTVTPAEAELVSLILDYAEFCGDQQDGEGGSLQLWTLRKPVLGHPKGSTVTRTTLLRGIAADMEAIR